MPLYDHNGNVVSTAALKEEFAAPELFGIRSVWQDTIASGLTPHGLAYLLEQAGRGYHDRYIMLAVEMEERDLHYASVLQTRKLAISGIEPIVEAGSENAEDEKIAEAVRDLISQPEFIDDYVLDLLDSLGKGFSVVETLWDFSTKQWWPKAYKWRDQRHFVIDRLDGQTLRLKDQTNLQGVDLPPFQFSIHHPKLKSGLPIRGGLARLAAWAFLFKSYTLKDWMAFLEVYGMPFRVGRYGKGTTQDERRVLLRAVRQLSTDAAAIIPKEMDIEFIEAKGGSGNAVFSAKAEYLDKQVSKGVLGQTMTSDNGASLAQAQIHEKVRQDIARADARQLAATVNRDLIRPFVDLNFGPRDFYPTVKWPVVEPEDVKALTEAITKLVPLGLKVSMSGVRNRIGFDEPDEEEELLVPPGAAQPPAGEDDPGGEPSMKGSEKARNLDLQAEIDRWVSGSMNDLTPVVKAMYLAREAKEALCPHCGGHHTASAQGDELNLLAEDALADWQKDVEPLLKPLKDLFDRATSYADIANGLDDLIAKMDAGPLSDRLAKLAMKARGLGDGGGDAGAGNG